MLGWVDSEIEGDVLVACVYLHDGEGWSDGNIVIMQAVARALVSLCQPSVSICVLNMSPDEFSQGVCIEHVYGAVVAPDEATYITATSQSIIDFFVVSASLQCAIETPPVVNYDGVGPHHSVHVILTGEGVSSLLPNWSSQPNGHKRKLFPAWGESCAKVCDQATLDSEFNKLCE